MSESMVYFAATKTAIKIGVSRNVRARIQTLQTACADELSLLATIKGNSATESGFHLMLSEHRLRGEWFKDCEQVRMAINDACGRDIFAAREALPPEAPPEPLLEDVGTNLLMAAKNRIIDFVEYCGEGGSGSLLLSLPMARRHLVIAAMRHAEAWFKCHQDAFLQGEAGSEQWFADLTQARLFADQLEEHVRFICGDEFASLLDGWPNERDRLASERSEPEQIWADWIQERRIDSNSHDHGFDPPQG